MVKVVTFFLIGIVVLAIFGRLGWFGGIMRRSLTGKRKSGKLSRPAICIKCGAPVIGAQGCVCDRPGTGEG
ncbi:hypothetical protein [Szabonella alba]|uniref:Uncharacterized protein n=1 Tax=Szabonella alba TaxID=2804194 RepID=A0A8K0V8V5_9RHOB|nr:hypothetical protein [Szabonella alba]MBL4915823.1 hypothetical protein [Szabonella alba]